MSRLVDIDNYLVLENGTIKETSCCLVVVASFDVGHFRRVDLGDCFADGILPVGCSRGKFLSGQKAYDVGILCIVLVPGSFDIPGSVFRFDPSDILFSGSFI